MDAFEEAQEDAVAMDPESQLHQSCFSGNDLRVKRHLKNGVNIEARHAIGWTPLHIASYGDKRKCVQLLLDKGADAEALTTNKQRTPLMVACTRNCVESVIVLLARSVNIAAVDVNGCTALHLACGKDKGLLLIELLISSGADVNVADSSGKTPLHWLCKKGDARGLSVLLKAGATLGVTDVAGNTPLHLVAMRMDVFSDDQTAIISGLLEAGADRSSLNIAGKTPLQECGVIAARDLLQQ